VHLMNDRSEHSSMFSQPGGEFVQLLPGFSARRGAPYSGLLRDSFVIV